MKVLGFDIDETTGRSACRTVRVCTPLEHSRAGYHVHVKISHLVSVEGRGDTLALAEGRASIKVAMVAEASAKLVAMCPDWPDGFPLCETCQEREATPEMIACGLSWCAECTKRAGESWGESR